MHKSQTFINLKSKHTIQALTHQYSCSCHWDKKGKDESLPVPIELIVFEKCHGVKHFADMRALNDALMLLTEGEEEEEGEGRGREMGGEREGGRLNVLSEQTLNHCLLTSQKFKKELIFMFSCVCLLAHS